MTRTLRRAWGAALMLCTPALPAGVTLLFDPTSIQTGPFPNDYLTSPDAQQKTGRRINLPLPDCDAEPGTCREYRLLNQLDGFNVFPRVSARFTGRINVDTLRDGSFFVALENLTNEERGLHTVGSVSPINQVVYDPRNDTAYAKPDQFLDQHRRYLLVFTDALKDAAGDAVQADSGFLDCINGVLSASYCSELARAVNEHASSFAGRRIIGASIFTTQSATAWLEKARVALQASPAVTVQRVGSVVDVSNVVEFTLRGQTRQNPAGFREFNGPLRPQGGIRMAFLSYRSPRFADDQGVIPPWPTGLDLPLPSRTDEIQFHAFLPATPPPASGYPVVLVCHGFGENRFTVPTSLAPAFAAAGMATISISIFGHGFGPQTTLILRQRDGSTVEVPAPGRSFDTDGDNRIESFEGGLVRGIPNTKYTAMQAVVDYMQLIRAIRAGLDADGDGRADFDGSRIFNVSHSFGVAYGTILNAVEPNVRAGVLIGGAGSIVDAAAIALPFRALTAIAFLENRVPNLLNRGAANYEQNHVYRDLPAVVNNVEGAIELQNFFERSEWFQNAGDALGYAVHLKQSPLPGVPAKPILMSWYLRDVTMPNPVTAQLIRAADMRESSRMFRQDLALRIVPELPADPHRFAFIEGPLIPAMATVAAALQEQYVGFFASNGTAIPDVNARLRPIFGRTMIETPAALPENVYYKAPGEKTEIE